MAQQPGFFEMSDRSRAPCLAAVVGKEEDRVLIFKIDAQAPCAASHKAYSPQAHDAGGEIVRVPVRIAMD